MQNQGQSYQTDEYMNSDVININESNRRVTYTTTEKNSDFDNIYAAAGEDIVIEATDGLEKLNIANEEVESLYDDAELSSTKNTNTQSITTKDGEIKGNAISDIRLSALLNGTIDISQLKNEEDEGQFRTFDSLQQERESRKISPGRDITSRKAPTVPGPLNERPQIPPPTERPPVPVPTNDNQPNDFNNNNNVNSSPYNSKVPLQMRTSTGSVQSPQLDAICSIGDEDNFTGIYVSQQDVKPTTEDDYAVVTPNMFSKPNPAFMNIMNKNTSNNNTPQRTPSVNAMNNNTSNNNTPQRTPSMNINTVQRNLSTIQRNPSFQSASFSDNDTCSEYEIPDMPASAPEDCGRPMPSVPKQRNSVIAKPRVQSMYVDKEQEKTDLSDRRKSLNLGDKIVPTNSNSGMSNVTDSLPKTKKKKFKFKAKKKVEKTVSDSFAQSQKSNLSFSDLNTSFSGDVNDGNRDNNFDENNSFV
eukprot:Pgem_evm1s2176